LWRYCRNLDLPDSLKEKLELFRSHGRIMRDNSELFPSQSWFHVMVGQGISPASDDPVAGVINPKVVNENLANIREVVKRCAASMPTHEEFIARHCAAPRPAA
jgi:tryptophan halogenase